MFNFKLNPIIFSFVILGNLSIIFSFIYPLVSSEVLITLGFLYLNILLLLSTGLLKISINLSDFRLKGLFLILILIDISYGFYLILPLLTSEVLISLGFFYGNLLLLITLRVIKVPLYVEDNFIKLSTETTKTSPETSVEGSVATPVVSEVSKETKSSISLATLYTNTGDIVKRPFNITIPTKEFISGILDKNIKVLWKLGKNKTRYVSGIIISGVRFLPVMSHGIVTGFRNISSTITLVTPMTSKSILRHLWMSLFGSKLSTVKSTKSNSKKAKGF
jgi:hypothetical protein